MNLNIYTIIHYSINATMLPAMNINKHDNNFTVNTKKYYQLKMTKRARMSTQNVIDAIYSDDDDDLTLTSPSWMVVMTIFRIWMGS